jgi:hypothetical protein
VFRLISEGFGWCLVVEALEACLVIGVDECFEEGIALVVGCELVLSSVAGRRLAADGLGDAAIEAFDHAVGLGMEGAGEPVLDLVPLADPVERMVAGGMGVGTPAGGPEAVGELGAVVGENGVHLVREGGEEAVQALGDSGRVAVCDDLDIGEAGRPVDGDEHIAGPAFEAGQVLEVDMHEADAGGLEGLGNGFVDQGPVRDAMALEAAVDGAPAEARIEAAVHDLDDVVERQLEALAQLDHQLFLERAQADRQTVRRVGAIGDAGAASPAPDRRLAHPQLGGERRHRGRARLNVRPNARRRGCVGMQLQVHHRRSSKNATPRSRAC